MVPLGRYPSPQELGPFPREHIWFLWEGTLLPRNLGLSPRKIHYSPKKLLPKDN